MKKLKLVNYVGATLASAAELAKYVLVLEQRIVALEQQKDK